MSEHLNSSTPESASMLGELVIRNGRPYFKDDDGLMYELNPKDNDEPFPVADYLPSSGAASSGSLEPANYKFTLEVSGRDYPDKIMQLVNQSPQLAAQNEVLAASPAPISSRYESFIDQDAIPIDYDEEDVSTQPVPIQTVPEVKKPAKKPSVERYSGKKRSRKLVVIGTAVVGSLVFGGFALGADEAGKNAGDICASKGLAGMWSDPGCVIQHLGSDALHLPIPESK